MTKQKAGWNSSNLLLIQRKLTLRQKPIEPQQWHVLRFVFMICRWASMMKMFQPQSCVPLAFA